MSEKIERFEFRTEAKQLLDLMIHSIYSNKDIFLRELISNSSDALDKRRFEALQEPHLLPEGMDLHILLLPDREKHTLSVVDNGIGMTREEVIELIGTIAKSGTAEFLKQLQETNNAEASAKLIGQFGVGFYSTFMVADKVTLLTRRAGHERAVRWESTGEGSYTLEEAEREEAGTTVTLHLKEVDEEEGVKDYTEEWVLRQIVKQYSDFVAYPIKMDVTREEVERDADGKPVDGAKPEKVIRTETLNSMKAIWLRGKDEVTEVEYNEFYKHIAHDWNPPLERIQAKMEGVLEYTILLYIPSKAPFDLFYAEGASHGVQLYVRRVFIMDRCEELLPIYLRFMRGVVDSEDLSLNISREILQQNRQIQRMRKGIVNKILSALKQMKDSDIGKYTTFWKEFGRVLKEGIFQDSENRQTLLELALFESTSDADELASLQHYVDRMKDGQEAIYYMTGQSRKKIEGSPHLEAFKAQGYEVLLLSDPVDEIWTQYGGEFAGKRFHSVGKGSVELGNEEEKKQAETQRKDAEKAHASLMSALKEHLKEQIKEVRLSSRLTSSPACLVTDTGDVSPQLEQMMKAMGQELPNTKRILELNPKHPILDRLQAAFDKDASAPELKDYAELLYGQAVLAEGGHLPDPGGFSRLVAELMVKSL